MQIFFEKDQLIRGKMEDLIDLPVVIHINDITEEHAKSFSENIRQAHLNKQQIIPVIIDSYGGDIYALFSMISVIESSKIPISTICIGKAISAGAILLACGNSGYRFMDKNAVVMIHETSTSNSWSKVTELSSNVTHSASLNALVFHKLDEVCRKEKNYFINLMSKNHNADYYMFSLEAKKHGIVDYIGIPNLKISMNLKFELMYNLNNTNLKNKKGKK